jgi:hypothetical protein
LRAGSEQFLVLLKGRLEFGGDFGIFGFEIGNVQSKQTILLAKFGIRGGERGAIALEIHYLKPKPFKWAFSVEEGGV